MKVVVGCPVFQRGWVLDRWFNAIAAPAFDLSFVFAYTPSTDGTLELIEAQRAAGTPVEILQVTEGDHTGKRDWYKESRLRTMATMRNMLLDYVATTDADLYLSLDSDILLPRDAIYQLATDCSTYHAVAPLVYLGVGNLTNAFFRKDTRPAKRLQDIGQLVGADIICAAKMMTRDLFTDDRVRYDFHTSGEDIAWSFSATEHGYQLGFDSRVRCKHVMKQDQLDQVDQRIGW